MIAGAGGRAAPPWWFKATWTPGSRPAPFPTGPLSHWLSSRRCARGIANAREPGREGTHAGIAEGARLLRSHVPGTLKGLQGEGFLEARDARLLGRNRKVRVYALTESGVRRARQILGEIDATRVEIEGRTTTLGEARRDLGLQALPALAALDAHGRMQPRVEDLERPTLLQREEDLAFLRRWLAGAAPIAVLYGSPGKRETPPRSAVSQGVPRAGGGEIKPGDDLGPFAGSDGRRVGKGGRLR